MLLPWSEDDLKRRRDWSLDRRVADLENYEKERRDSPGCFAALVGLVAIVVSALAMLLLVMNLLSRIDRIEKAAGLPPYQWQWTEPPAKPAEEAK